MPDGRTWMTVAACLVLASGCGVVDWLRGKPEPIRPATASIEHEAALVLDYLATLRQLSEAMPTEQAELTAWARSAAVLEPTTSNRLRYALVLGLPGHPASDPLAARTELGNLLAAPEGMFPAEVTLANVMYQDVNARLALESENRRLAEQAAREGQDRVQAISRRLQAQTAETARLRQQLDEALAKLEAVAALERSIAERNIPPQNPPK